MENQGGGPKQQNQKNKKGGLLLGKMLGGQDDARISASRGSSMDSAAENCRKVCLTTPFPAQKVKKGRRKRDTGHHSTTGTYFGQGSKLKHQGTAGLVLGSIYQGSILVPVFDPQLFGCGSSCLGILSFGQKKSKEH